MSYCTLDALKSALKIVATNEDTLLTTFLGAAQSVIDSTCHRTFEASADTVKTFHALDDLDDTDKHLLYLFDAKPNLLDLCQITTVTNGDATVITTADYVTVPPNVPPFTALRIKHNSSKFWTYTTNPDNAISITGRWAYSIAAPASIIMAHLRLAMWFYRQRDTSADVVNIIPGRTGVQILPGDLPRDVMALLRPFMKDWL
jgi:hypothetical protein